jgi:hypothetical protein
VQPGRVEKELPTDEVEAMFECEVKYAFAAAASAAVGSLGFVEGEVDLTRRSMGVSKSCEAESSSDMSPSRSARAAKPVGASEDREQRECGGEKL